MGRRAPCALYSATSASLSAPCRANLTSNSRPLTTKVPNASFEVRLPPGELEAKREFGQREDARDQLPVQDRIERLGRVRELQRQAEIGQRRAVGQFSAETVTPKFSPVITKRSRSSPPAWTMAAEFGVLGELARSPRLGNAMAGETTSSRHGSSGRCGPTLTMISEPFSSLNVPVIEPVDRRVPSIVRPICERVELDHVREQGSTSRSIRAAKANSTSENSSASIAIRRYVNAKLARSDRPAGRQSSYCGPPSSSSTDLVEHAQRRVRICGQRPHPGERERNRRLEDDRAQRRNSPAPSRCGCE